MTTYYRTIRPAFVPTTGSTGLLEKRQAAYSHLGLTDAVAKVSSWKHSASNDLDMEDDVSSHVNHGRDPGTSTLNLSQNAGFNWISRRGLTEALALTDFAHASLEGYHPPGSGSGDPDLSQHVMTSSGNIAVGQPVYVSSNNVVGLATANPGSPMPNYALGQVIGLCLVAGTNGNAVTIITEGSVTQNDWTGVVGATSLVPGAIYFLDSTAGKLSYTPPSTDSHLIVRVGRALTTKKMDIEVGETTIL